MLLTLVNGLLGAVCGVWFRVQILVPLVAFACVEQTIVQHTGASWSVFWYAPILIGAIEIGYLAGASGAALWLLSGRETMPHDFAR